MKSFLKTDLLLAETGAFCWFMLRRIPFPYLIPLIPLGVFWVRIPLSPPKLRLWLNGCFMILSLALGSRLTGAAIYNGGGTLTLLFLFLAAGVFSANAPEPEWKKIARAWCLLLLAVFLLLTLGAVFGARAECALPGKVSLRDLAVFYLLALGEPLGFREAGAAPVLLGGALLPFSVVSCFALGAGAFNTAEFPYLSVWTGVSVAAFHHVEGVMIGFLCGLCALRAGSFFLLLRQSSSRIKRRIRA